MRVSAREQRQTTQMELFWGHWIYFVPQTWQFAKTNQGSKQKKYFTGFPFGQVCNGAHVINYSERKISFGLA